MNGQTIVREGVMVGLTGALVVAVWFFLYDLAAGAPFRTPALLGAMLFEGARDPSSVAITTGLVLKYTVVHGLAFIAFGVAAAGLFALADRDRRVLFAVFMLFCCLEVAAFLMIFVLAERLLEDLAPWAILGANLLAAVVMLALLFHSHRRSPAELLVAGE